jgi:hypothetical protein
MKLLLSALFLISFISGYSQSHVVIDGDKLLLRDSLNGKMILLSSIERSAQNSTALWITYDRRPGVDPWISTAQDKATRFSETQFVNYWKENGVRILGAFTTYDDCQCAKYKSGDSPDMYLIHFKLFPDDWEKLKEVYPLIEEYVKKVR